MRLEAEPGTAKPEHRTHLANFVIDKVDADDTQLYVLRKDPNREPLQFELRRLTLRSAGVGQPMTFKAQLTNPTPPGLIDTIGHFGPWDLDQPSDTRVDGHYIFQHADLSVFNGISGILSSVGDYHGVLHNIVVDGTTDTPDFKLDSGGQSVHLTTQFHAIVDGTNGNTYSAAGEGTLSRLRHRHQRRGRRATPGTRARRFFWTSTFTRRGCRMCWRWPPSPIHPC